MIKTLIAILSITCLLPTAFATDTNAVLNAWFAAQKNVKTLSADFTQIRAFKTLTMPLTAHGHLWFAVPDKFRWELGAPPRTIALRRGNVMFVIYPLLKRAERYPMGAAAPQRLRESLSLLDAGLPRSRQAFDAQFNVLSLQQTNGAWQLAAQPKSAAARQTFPELEIVFSTNDFSLAGTELFFVDGSTMRNDFTNETLNPPLAPKLFQWQPPPGYTVTQPVP
ncbi:MAG: outer membrane lipoprotein carrier protein LolA [Verrucomicrobia bacterium]|nr:outer membrane lipoprotein carrier protein LolA [Verrucomicrobiota bacterium]MDE3098165.1 outer membrane lipoprotein carrier protein LolA [Verrucomicrobiota bacterium]